MSMYSLFFLAACTDLPTLSQSEPTDLGVSTETVQQIEQELNGVFELWEDEQYFEAFDGLTHIKDTSMEGVWPILREADPESSLRLEVAFGKSLSATKRKNSIDSTKAPQQLRNLLMRELNDVRQVEPIEPIEPSEPTNTPKEKGTE